VLVYLSDRTFDDELALPSPVFDCRRSSDSAAAMILVIAIVMQDRRHIPVRSVKISSREFQRPDRR
jgi:hypothetical protein